MFAIMGITGQVGAQVAETLLAAGAPVRAIVRDQEKGAPWAARGCEVAVVRDAEDEEALAKALSSATGAFVMMPPDYDPEPGFPAAHRVARAYADAIRRAGPGRIVALSSVGAQIGRFNLLNNAGILERALADTDTACGFLRPAWFIENAAWDVADARASRIESYLHPLDRPIDMVSVRDIGRVAADLLRETWSGNRVVELAGPVRVSPDDLARAFSAALGRSVEIAVVPREQWETRFRSQRMRHPEARIAMLAGFNEGWLDFERTHCERRTGTIDLEAVVAALVSRP